MKNSRYAVRQHQKSHEAIQHTTDSNGNIARPALETPHRARSLFVLVRWLANGLKHFLQKRESIYAGRSGAAGASRNNLDEIVAYSCDGLVLYDRRMAEHAVMSDVRCVAIAVLVRAPLAAINHRT